MIPTKEQFEGAYKDLIGFVPQQISTRIGLGLEVDPELTEQFESLRRRLMNSEALDAKSVQLILFGQLLVLLAPTARYHALAAKRVGASTGELHAIAGLALLVRGMQAFNLAGEAISWALEKDP